MIKRRDFFKTLALGMAALGITSLKVPEPSSLPSYSGPILAMSDGLALVSGCEIRFSDRAVVYEAGFVEVGGPGPHYIYADDDRYKGGHVPYQATSNYSDLFARKGRIYFGRIAT